MNLVLEAIYSQIPENQKNKVEISFNFDYTYLVVRIHEALATDLDFIMQLQSKIVGRYRLENGKEISLVYSDFSAERAEMFFKVAIPVPQSNKFIFFNDTGKTLSIHPGMAFRGIKWSGEDFIPNADIKIFTLPPGMVPMVKVWSHSLLIMDGSDLL